MTDLPTPLPEREAGTAPQRPAPGPRFRVLPAAAGGVALVALAALTGILFVEFVDELGRSISERATDVVGDLRLWLARPGGR